MGVTPFFTEKIPRFMNNKNKLSTKSAKISQNTCEERISC